MLTSPCSQIFLKSPENGTAELKTRHPLDCEVQENYLLSIAAVACNGQISTRLAINIDITNITICISKVIRVHIEDVNEYAPEWTEKEYSGHVEEEEVSELIVRVTAIDKDCSSKTQGICSYSIQDDDGTFSINPSGAITNTVSLSLDTKRTHLLFVVATDCGGKKSSPVPVVIKVVPQCQTSWTGELFFSNSSEIVCPIIIRLF